MSDQWAKAIAELAALLKRWGAALAAYLAGRRDAAGKAERRAVKAREAAREEQDEKDAEYHLRINDPRRRERVREFLEKDPAADD